MAGTIENPVSFVRALASTKIRGGDTLLRHPGISSGDFVSTFGGTSLVTIKPLSGDFKVSGSIAISGNNNRWENCEFHYKDWLTRTTDISGSTPADIPYSKGQTINAENLELYRCVIHDSSGLGWWIPSKNSKLTECVIFFNGWSGPDRGHGHGVYTQNNVGVKILERCIIFWNFSLGIKIYGESAGPLSGYTLKDCILFDTGILYDRVGDQHIQTEILTAGHDVTSDLIIDGCEIYKPAGHLGAGIDVGYISGLTDFEIKNCYIVAEYSLLRRVEAVLTNGSIINNYLYGKTTFTVEEIPGNVIGTRPESGKRMRVIDCGGGRAHIAIYNYDLDDTVAVDMTGIMATGDSYSLTNVQDFFNDVITGVVGEDNIITVPMIGRTIGTPIQWTAPDSLFPEFGCFIIEKVV